MKRRIYSGWEVLRLQRELEEVLAACTVGGEHHPAVAAPAVDIQEWPDRFVVLLDLPGVHGQEVRVSIGDRVLRVAGRKSAHCGQARGRRYHTVERHQGRFEVEVWLPGPISRDGTAARMRSGVLEITLPRIAERRNTVHDVAVTDEET
jgi:HSP20 family protein